MQQNAGDDDQERAVDDESRIRRAASRGKVSRWRSARAGSLEEREIAKVRARVRSQEFLGLRQPVHWEFLRRAGPTARRARQTSRHPRRPNRRPRPFALLHGLGQDLAVEGRGGQELFVSAVGDDATVFEDDDALGEGDGRDAVRDDQRGA